MSILMPQENTKRRSVNKTVRVPQKKIALAQTRQEHALEIAEDYVELIADLIVKNGEARAIDLARLLGVTHVTVGKTIRRLQKLALVETQPYRSIFLTEAGRRLAKQSKERHQIVLQFLLSLGVSPLVAESDSEGIEHHVSKETLNAFKKFLRQQE